jgi:hypothetical protein
MGKIMEAIQLLELKVREIKESKYQHQYYSFDVPISQKEDFVNHIFYFSGVKELTFQNNTVLPSGIDCVLNYCGLTFLIRFIE